MTDYIRLFLFIAVLILTPLTVYAWLRAVDAIFSWWGRRALPIEPGQCWCRVASGGECVMTSGVDTRGNVWFVHEGETKTMWLSERLFRRLFRRVK